MRSGSPLADIERWLATTERPIGEEALRKHRKEHVVGEASVSGPRPTSGSFLQAVVERTHSAMEAGELTPTIQNGISAQDAINRQADKQSDRDMMLQLAQVLGGGWKPNVIEGEYREWDDRQGLLEAEFAHLLPKE